MNNLLYNAPAQISSDPTPLKTFERDEVERTLKILTNGVWEIRALNASLTGGRYNRGGTVSGYFNSIPKCLDELGRITKASGIYITLNPVLPDLMARTYNRLVEAEQGSLTKDHQVVDRRWLLIDLDAIRVQGVSSTEAEVTAAMIKADIIKADLTAKGWPDPVVSMSGNGYHLLYRVDIPCNKGDKSADEHDLLKRVLQGLGAQYSDDSIHVDLTVFNASRITKLYGTLVAKGDNCPELGRIHRMSRLVSVPEILTTISIEMLEGVATIPGTKSGAVSSSTISTASATTIDWSRDKAVKRLDSWVSGGKVEVASVQERGAETYYILKECPWASVHTGGDNPQDAAIIVRDNGSYGFKCFHSHCAGRSWQDVKSMLGLEAEPKSAGAAKPSGIDPDSCLRGWDQVAKSSTTSTTSTASTTAITTVMSEKAVNGSGSPLVYKPTLLSEVKSIDQKDRWLIKGVIPKVGFTLIAAAPKLGKSMIAMDLAIAISHGTPWMTNLQTCAMGSVLYLSLDQATELTHDRMVRLGCDLTADIRLLGAGQTTTIDMGGKEAMLAYLNSQKIAGTPIALVVVDIWQNFASSRETRKNAYQADYSVLNDIRSICTETATTFVLLHHTNKQGDVSGSTAFGGAPDCIIQMTGVPLPKKHEVHGWRLFRRIAAKITSRWGGMDELGIDMWGETMGDADAEGRAVICASSSPGMKTESLRDAILTALAEVDTEEAAITVSDIKDICGDMGRHDSGGAIKKALSRMAKDDLVYRSKRGCYYLAATGVASSQKSSPPPWIEKKTSTTLPCHYVTNSVTIYNDKALCGDIAGDTVVTSDTSCFLDAEVTKDKKTVHKSLFDDFGAPGDINKTSVTSMSPTILHPNPLEPEPLITHVDVPGDIVTGVYTGNVGDVTHVCHSAAKDKTESTATTPTKPTPPSIWDDPGWALMDRGVGFWDAVEV